VGIETSPSSFESSWFMPFFRIGDLLAISIDYYKISFVHDWHALPKLISTWGNFRCARSVQRLEFAVTKQARTARQYISFLRITDLRFSGLCDCDALLLSPN